MWQSRGSGTQNWEWGRGRTPEARGTGAQGRAELGMKGHRSPGLGARGAGIKIGAGAWVTKNLGLSHNLRPSGVLGRSRLEPKYPYVGDPSHKSPPPYSEQGWPGGGRGGGAKFSEL